MLKFFFLDSFDSKKVVAFLLLPYLFPSIRGRSKSIKSNKISKIEIQEKFIAHFNVGVVI